MENKNMTPTPWKVFLADEKTCYPGIESTKKGATCPTIALYGEKGDEGGIRGLDNAEAIVSAVNGTYGKSINPEAVEIMLNALKFAINIKELWMPSFDETPPEHAGEMDALSRMRNVLNYAIEAATIK